MSRESARGFGRKEQKESVNNFMRDAYIKATSPMYWAFNIWDQQSAKAVLAGAASCEKSVILQTSIKSFTALDKENLRYMVTNFNKKHHVNAFLHLDHCKEMEMIKEAIELGWDSVMIDASNKELEENIAITNEVSEFVHGKNRLIEAEIGEIQGVEDDIRFDEALAVNMQDVKKFVQNTKVDMLAVAIGTAHGLYRGKPDLQYHIIENVKKITQIPFVIHGGSGLSDETFIKLMSYDNVKKINVSTDVKLAYRDAIQQCYQEGMCHTDQFDPLLVDTCIHEKIKNMVVHKLKL